jgi:hypothetical protein
MREAVVSFLAGALTPAPGAVGVDVSWWGGALRTRRVSAVTVNLMARLLR